MKSAIFLFLLTFLFFGDLSAQSKEAFEKIFLKETEGKRSAVHDIKFKNITTLSYYPDTLPNWFFNPPPSTSSYVYAIGISDPDLTPEEAYFQAVYRAQSMAVLLYKAQIQYFRDIYTVEYQDGNYTKYGQRFDTYFKLSATGRSDSLSFKIMNQHFTRYNEAVVLIKYSQSDLPVADDYPTMSLTGTVLYIEAQVGEAFEPQVEYEVVSALMAPNSPMKLAQFTYREIGKRFLSMSEFLGKDMQFPLYSYMYADPSWSSSIQPLVSYNGLWSIFTQKLLRHLTLTAEQSSVRIRTLEEQYSPQMSNLSREVAIKTAKILINGIEFGVDSIGFDINIQEIH